jgi:hypothetical protein
MKQTEIFKAIDAAQCVSFDLFDTLLVRMVKNPADIFGIIESTREVSGFKQVRINAEKEARERSSSGVVTLDEIYSLMTPEYQNLKADEITAEKKLCKAHPVTFQYYQHALQSGKKIAITADTYLTREVVDSLLKENGITAFQYLLLSYEVSKTGDDLLKAQVDQAKVTPDLMLHFEKATFDASKQVEESDEEETVIQFPEPQDNLGIKKIEIPGFVSEYGAKSNSGYFALLNNKFEYDPAVTLHESLVAYHNAANQDEDYWKNFGYKYIGILAAGYVDWVIDQARKKGISFLLFIRNGSILRQIADIMAAGMSSDSINASRRLYSIAGISDRKDVKQIVLAHAKGLSYEDLWQEISIESQELYAAYTGEFPDQLKTIRSAKDINAIDQFFRDHDDELQTVIMQEREALRGYLGAKNVLTNKIAFIDLGWEGSSAKGIAALTDSVAENAYFYYLGTEACCTNGLNVSSWLLDHGASTGAKNANVLKNEGYILQILELAFASPEAAIVKIQKNGEYSEPVYSAVDGFKQKRADISRQIADGAVAYAIDYINIARDYTITISKDMALAALQYLAAPGSRADEYQLSKVSFTYDPTEQSGWQPILKQQKPVLSGINPWPGDMSAEAEVLTRLTRGAEELGYGIKLVDGFGHLLDKHQRMTKTIVTGDDVSFVISSHYETSKTIDAFTYHTVWNPPEIPMALDYYTQRVTNNYIMNDDYLIYDSGGMSNHLKSMLMNCPRNVDQASMLTASFPASAMLEPKLDNPTMFYCGMNWEKVTKSPARHGGLFKLLDRTGKIKFFGPDKNPAWGNIEPWGGYKCYQYPIPFDGFSILKEINECGVCLCLSSDIHRRAGAATNRTYEACAAGAVIISDDNEFMLKNFRDAAIFITYNREDPEDTFRQIMEKFDWINSHREEALQLAQRAQEIFRQKYSLDVQLRDIVKRHPARLQQIESDLYAKDTSKTVLVSYVLGTLKGSIAQELLNRVFKNLENQVYDNITLAVAADRSIAEEVKKYCDRHYAGVVVFPMELFDSKKVRAMTDGQAIRTMQKAIPHDYYMNTIARENWYRDHVTTLVRAIENEAALGSYSGAECDGSDGYRRTMFFDIVNRTNLYDEIENSQHFPTPGQFMFTAQADELLPDYLFSNLDGKEHYAYCNLIKFRYQQKLAFSRRMTFVYDEKNNDERGKVVKDSMQCNFIQDMVHMYLKEVAFGTAKAAVGSVDRQAIEDSFRYVPIKALIKIRWLYTRMRHAVPGSEKFKKLEKKYYQVLGQYNANWSDKKLGGAVSQVKPAQDKGDSKEEKE